MGHGGEIFSLNGDTAFELGFETAFRGYDKRQVDRHVANLESENEALRVEREETLSHVQSLTAHVSALEAEVGEYRRRVGDGGKVSFRHLGARTEQLLA